MSTSLDWFRNQIEPFKRERPRYERLAEALRPILETVAQSTCRHAIVQARAKTVRSFAEKALRKRDQRPDPNRQFTDLCGGRIITCLQSEVEAVCAALREHFLIESSNCVDALGRLHNREFGYRSVHYVVQFRPEKIPAEIKSLDNDVYKLKAEVLSKVFDYYTRAYETNPTDPQALCGYVRYKIATERNLDFLNLLRPAMTAAMQKCRPQTAAGMILASSLYQLGELSVVLGAEHAHEGLMAYLGAIRASTTSHQLEQALDALSYLEAVKTLRPGIDTARRLLTLALTVRYPDAEGKSKSFHLLEELRSNPPVQPPVGPIVIVAGSCDPAFQSQMEQYRVLLLEAFARFRGTVFSGGTREGIAGLVGEIGMAHPDRITTVGYLPATLPVDGTATRDSRYLIFRTTAGQQFSVLEPIQSWIDLIAAGVDPKKVRVLGINGGRIAEFEYRLALLLGAKVGLVRDSGRKADALAAETETEPAPGLASLPPDPMTIEAFLMVGTAAVLTEEQRQTMARRIHQRYCEKTPIKPIVADPATLRWEDLQTDYQSENLLHADDFQRKLAALGLQAVPVSGREIKYRACTPKELELLAEMEHGRYVASKLLQGWTLGPRGPRRRPSLVAWKELGEEERDRDRDLVREMPQMLKEMGFEIQQV